MPCNKLFITQGRDLQHPKARKNLPSLGKRSMDNEQVHECYRRVGRWKPELELCEQGVS